MKKTIPTPTLRESLTNTVEAELSNFPTLLADLPPKARLAIVCKLLPYVMAKQEPPQDNDLWGE